MKITKEDRLIAVGWHSEENEPNKVYVTYQHRPYWVVRLLGGVLFSLPAGRAEMDGIIVKWSALNIAYIACGNGNDLLHRQAINSYLGMLGRDWESVFGTENETTQ